MLILRMLKKGRAAKGASIIHLIICVILVCLSIYTWELLGCVGFPECYLCKAFTPDFMLNPLAVNSSNDFTKLMDLKNFTFLINNHACSNNSDLFLLVLVHSAPINFEKRATIRNTWGKTINGKLKVLFMLGIPNSSYMQKRLNEENNDYKDIVQGNFIDAYRNLTYKHVMALKWTKYFCPNVKFMLKTDDDFFVNSPSFLEYVKYSVPEKKLMRCSPIFDGRAQRTWRSKWKVTWAEYKFRLYPPFCPGYAVLYSIDVVLDLYAKAQMANYFWIDDVFVTGFMAKSANVTPTTFGNFMMKPHEYQRLISTGAKGFSFLLGPWNLSVMDMRTLWEKALSANHVTNS